MKDLTNNLNKIVANFGVLYIKLHNYHWFVKGVQFYQLHSLFEKLYDEVTEHFDAVAERVLMIGDRPVATVSDMLVNATVKDATNEENLSQMLETTIADFSLIDNDIIETIKIAQEQGDEVTIDLLIGISTSIQKHLWMLRTTMS